jgi:hypothetical protein
LYLIRDAAEGRRIPLNQITRRNSEEGEVMARWTLGGKLFRLVEREQGYAFISDGIDGLPDDRVLDIARGSLAHTKVLVKQLERFIKTHERLTTPQKGKVSDG